MAKKDIKQSKSDNGSYTKKISRTSLKVSRKNLLKPFHLKKSREISDQTSYKNKRKLSRNMANKTTLFGFDFKNTDERFGCPLHNNKSDSLSIHSFKRVLQDPPDILHLAVHGQYKDDGCEYVFDNIPAVRILLDPSHPFSAYYAVIAIFFEDEMVTFTRQQNKNITNIPINQEFRLLGHKSSQKLLENIAKIRFGCYIEKSWDKYSISRGMYKKSEHKSNLFSNSEYEYELVSKPHKILKEYLLETIFAKDVNVQKIRNEILELYDINRKRNLGKHQQYDWNELSECIENIIDKRIMSEFLNDDYSIKQEHSKEAKQLTRKCNVILNSYMDYTMQLCHVNKDQMKQLMDTIEENKKINLEFKTQIGCNKWILRFKDKESIREVTKIVSDIKKTDSNIELNEPCKPVSHYCGYIPKVTQGEDKLKINLKNRDKCPISNIIDKYLNSRNQCKIKLLIVNGCHSFQFGELFKKYVKLIICVHPSTAIHDDTCIKFANKFYFNFTKYTINGQGFTRAAYLSYWKSLTDIEEQVKDQERECHRIHIHEHHCSHKGNNNINNHVNNNSISGLETTFEGKSIENEDDLKPIGFIRNVTPKTIDQLVNNHKVKAQVCEINGCSQLSGCKILAKSLSEAKSFDMEMRRIIKQRALSLNKKSLSNVTSNDIDAKMSGLAWNAHPSHDCCCNAYIPHNIKHKYVLLFNGHIINEPLKFPEIRHCQSDGNTPFSAEPLCGTPPILNSTLKLNEVPPKVQPDSNPVLLEDFTSFGSNKFGSNGTIVDDDDTVTANNKPKQNPYKNYDNGSFSNKNNCFGCTDNDDDPFKFYN